MREIVNSIFGAG